MLLYAMFLLECPFYIDHLFEVDLKINAIGLMLHYVW
jgi:hypothetical protein